MNNVRHSSQTKDIVLFLNVDMEVQRKPHSWMYFMDVKILKTETINILKIRKLKSVGGVDRRSLLRQSLLR